MAPVTFAVTIQMRCLCRRQLHRNGVVTLCHTDSASVVGVWRATRPLEFRVCLDLSTTTLADLISVMLGSEEADATGGKCMKGATMKHRAVSDTRLILSIGLLSAMTIFITGCQTSTPAPSTGGYPLTVMSQNMFGESSDLTPSLTATSLPAYKAAVGEIFREVQASDAPGRATAAAHEIGVSRPDIIGLQEVFSWLTGPLGSPPATKVAYDQLQLLLGALASQGLHYAPVATLTDSDIEDPNNLGFHVPPTDH